MKQIAFPITISLMLAAACIHAADTQPQNPDEVSWGVSAWQGRRPEMEDFHAVEADSKQAFFGIYDGWGGELTAQIVAHGMKSSQQNKTSVNALHQHFFAASETNAAEKLAVAFDRAEQELRNNWITLIKSSVPHDLNYFGITGTTAVTAVLEDDMCTLAWAGDSRAVLAQGNSLHATTDHKPSEPNEQRRIQLANGTITPPQSSRHIHRLNSLAMSRCLGGSLPKMLPGISAKPDIVQIELNGNNTFLILACDGIWDVLTNEQAATIVAQALNTPQASLDPRTILKPHDEQKLEEGNNSTAIRAARALCKAAYTKGSSDNLSALVVQIYKQDGVDFSTKF